MRSGTAGAAQDRHARFAIQQRGQLFEVLARWRDDWRRQQQVGRFGRWRIGGRLQRHIAGNDDDGHAALADGFADRNFEHARHLVGAGHQFAIMAALPKQLLRMRFLEIAGADLGRGDVRGDRQYWHARAVTIEQPVDQVKVARPAAAGADRDFSGEMRLGARGKGGDLLVPDMQPFDLALPTNRIGKAVQAVADNAVNPLDTSGGEGLGELVSDGFWHWALLHQHDISPGVGSTLANRLWWR